jgi:hypothetical protein
MLASLALTVALATAAAQEPPAQTYALIIGNNQSLGLRRPALQYADDDAVKYAELFGTLMPAQNVVLLTELDRDTERLYPQHAARVRQPTRANVEAALDELARRTGEARSQGAQVSFYFIFAGHGDVDEGRGFLELEDAAFTAADMERSLRRVPAARTHVILDSCNSFFVLNPRKPGGKRFSTPRDAMEGLARRMPTVGVFLSTSAEAEVYEWSELQSGIFSHTVRSGLAGAADANRDGSISYAELSGFVELAAREVRNPLFRPKVFARGPGDDNRQELVRLGSARAVLLEAGGAQPVRLTVRDADGGRWLDAHVEAGATVSLRLPASLARGMSVEQPSEEGVKRSRLGADLATVALASLSLRQAPEQSRGPGELLKALFSTPFGPQALAALEQERATQPEPVYGLSQEDVSRMSLLVGELGDSERKRRLYGRGIDIAMGSGMLGLGFVSTIAAPWRADGVVGLIVMSAGTLQLAGSAFLLHRQSEGEELARHFQEKLSTPGYDPAQLVAQTEMQLQLLLNQERRQHRVTQTVGGLYGAMAVGILVINETGMGIPEEYKYAGRNLGAFLAVVSARMILSTYFEKSSTEQVIRIWQNDPGIKNLPRVSLAPLSGGGMFSLQGTF